MQSQKRSTLNKLEVDKFSRIADEWWDENGKFRPLHAINPLRIQYIKDQSDGINGKDILDVGCGGGILSLPMARQGAKVIGLDASEENIKIAGNYAARQGVNIDFKCDLIENYSKTHKKKFDIITALEVIEHVDNVEVFLDNLDKCLKSGGFLFISTINRTLKSMALAKIAAEYLLRIVPIGTHDWNKFIKPEEITDHLAGKYELVNISGIILNPLTASWNISDRTSVNYIMTLKKK